MISDERKTSKNQNTTTAKSDPAIVFRGKLDSLESEVILLSSMVISSTALHLDLEKIAEQLNKMLVCHFLEADFDETTILSLDFDSLREISYHPKENFGLEVLQRFTGKDGFIIASLNNLRAKTREVETFAVKIGADISYVKFLNRLSSAFFILAGREYKNQNKGEN